MERKKFKGIKDLLDCKQQDLQKYLIDSGAIGNYYSTVNIHNLVNGKVSPTDAFTYVLLARITEHPVEIILKRYSFYEGE
jgi:hypothetical protein